MTVIITARKAVKPHVCNTCGRWIKSGQKYLRRFFTPDELGGVFYDNKCAKCAARSKERPDLLA